MGGQIVCIDAGHGGHDPGAMGAKLADGSVPFEKDWALQQALVAGAFVQAAGFRPLFTRTDDTFVPLSRRAETANAAAAAAFVSIHWNSATPNADGTIVMHHAESPNGKRLAEEVFAAVAPLDGERGERNERIWPVPDSVDGSRWEVSAPTVLSRTSMPAIIVEVEFGSNPEEVVRMLNPRYQMDVGRGIAEGLVRFFAS